MIYFRKGLTLIEVMIVVIIIGIIISFAAPSYINSQRKARDKIARVQLELIQNAEKMHRLETGGYVACDGNLNCQDALDIDLPSSPRDWKYKITVSGATFCAQASDGGGSQDYWSIRTNEDEAQASQCP